MKSTAASAMFSRLRRSRTSAAGAGGQSSVGQRRVKLPLRNRLRQLLLAFGLSLGVVASTGGATALAVENALDLEAYAGKVVYLDFWASWCTPCRASFPFMHDLAEEFADELAVVAVNLDKKRELASTFLADFDVNFDIVYDPEARIASEYDLKGMPTSFLLNRKGEPVAQHIGFRKKDVAKLRAAVKAEVERQP